MLIAGIASVLVLMPSWLSSQQSAAVRIDNDDIGGVVTSTKGPEAGVWVIAETTDLPTKFAKIVVTDDQGRYVMPDLPKANYSIWVRGYGLVDSPRVKAVPGKVLNLKAVVARNEAAAAEYYPADLLVLHTQDSGQERIPFGKGEKPERVVERGEDQWLHNVPPNGQ